MQTGLDLGAMETPSMKYHCELGIAVLLFSSSAALASSASVGPLACWTADSTIEMVDCSSQSNPDGGAIGHCTIITAPEGKRLVTKVDGVMKPWGGIHPIHKQVRSLKIRYDRGRFSCSFTPSGEYTVGDCVIGAASGSCTVMKSTNGSNRYFKAAATARPE